MASQANPDTAKTVYEFSANDIKGEPVSMEKYRGHVLIVVNVASKCGYTAQHYKELNELYAELGETKGLCRWISFRWHILLTQIYSVTQDSAFWLSPVTSSPTKSPARTRRSSALSATEKSSSICSRRWTWMGRRRTRCGSSWRRSRADSFSISSSGTSPSSLWTRREIPWSAMDRARVPRRWGRTLRNTSKAFSSVHWWHSTFYCCGSGCRRFITARWVFFAHHVLGVLYAKYIIIGTIQNKMVRW